MKKIFMIAMLLIASAGAFAQQTSPVKWAFASRKMAGNAYEVTLTATFAKPWHLYSQYTPDGGPLATKISFGLNPLLQTDGDAKEKGKLITKHDETFGVDVKYFSDRVEFVKTVKLKSADVKTNVRGNIEYMVCNDSKCLPPVKQAFDIKLQ